MFKKVKGKHCEVVVDQVADGTIVKVFPKGNNAIRTNKEIDGSLFITVGEPTMTGRSPNKRIDEIERR